MSEQALDLRRTVHLLRRHRVAAVLAAMAGLLAGIGYMALYPPMLSGEALVVVTTASSNATATQIIIAGSSDVLVRALPRVDPPMSLSALRNRIEVTSIAPSVISIAASGTTATQADRTANAVADSYVAYLASPDNASGKVRGRLLQPAGSATGPSRLVRTVVAALLGALAGTLIGAVGILALNRRDRRLRLRDEIADAIGVPVIASLPVSHPADAGSWSRLLEGYRPNPAVAWRLRSALRYLGLPDVLSAHAGSGGSGTLSVISLSSDQRALALGPQLAVFAAVQGVATDLIVGPDRDAGTKAALLAACAVPPSAGRPWALRVGVADHARIGPRPDATLTVVVTVVDDRAPRLDEAIRGDVAVLVVSPGAATADVLARVAASAAACGSQIAGLLIANPDPADHTTGRVPQLIRQTRRPQPTRVAGIPEARRQGRESSR